MTPRSKHILIVDDEADICDLLRAHLTEIGYEVSLAIDAERGREILHGQRIDLLISDQIISGEIGSQLADFAGTLGVPAILMSGHPATFETLPGSNHAFIRKPFSLDDLVDLITDVLALRSSV